jgi:hypothetical protein
MLKIKIGGGEDEGGSDILEAIRMKDAAALEDAIKALVYECMGDEEDDEEEDDMSDSESDTGSYGGE